MSTRPIEVRLVKDGQVLHSYRTDHLVRYVTMPAVKEGKLQAKWYDNDEGVPLEWINGLPRVKHEPDIFETWRFLFKTFAQDVAVYEFEGIEE